MNSKEIRRIFFDYFTENRHQRVVSAPLVPAQDPTLLFTNAGMNQFKGVFLQQEKRGYQRAVTIQKCMRVSGKHNDFDEVGKTPFHHTFFEMMGNFSFGDYFKKEAIRLAWQLLTERYGFSAQRLWITVFREDDEAHRIWEEEIGVAPERIVRLDEKDNFWQMGDTGPCGPCSEIHFDRGEAYGPAAFVDGNRRYVEIWNLVFMQYNRDPSGTLHPLPAPSIDTGMGLERLSLVLQEKESNYQTDLFRPIIEFTADLCGRSPDEKGLAIPFNVVADHARALTFLIGDGVIPANDGRGYVLRRILRRAAKHGRHLGFSTPFLDRVSGRVIDLMSAEYPELDSARHFIAEVIRSEEERFAQTLSNGLKRFEEILESAQAQNLGVLPGEELFKLSDTYGFPLDFAVDLATERDIRVDVEGFHQTLENRRNESRRQTEKKQKSRTTTLFSHEPLETPFCGYEKLEEQAEVLALADERETLLDQAEAGVSAFLLCDITPFYPEGGGQVSDIGRGLFEGGYFTVRGAFRCGGSRIVHDITVEKGTLKKGMPVLLQVNAEHRQACAVHHTSTHLLHAALREHLGLHVKQAGSYVGPDKLRFDYTHFKSLSTDDIRQIERRINREIRANHPVTERETSFDQALSEGAMAIFEEKYGDRVRMISIDPVSKELCGGTHLKRTGEIGLFSIQSEASIASGIRRIEAIGGDPALLRFLEMKDRLQELCTHSRKREEELLDHLQSLEKGLKELKKQKQTAPSSEPSPAVERQLSLNGFRFTLRHYSGMDRKALSSAADEIKRSGSAAIVSSVLENKTMLVVSLPETIRQRLHAGQLTQKILETIQGSGGGRPDFAQGGADRAVDPVDFQKVITELLTKAMN